MPDRLLELDRLLRDMNHGEMARAWARCMRMLRVPNLVRTANTPVGDYAERVCCDRFGLERKGFSEKSVDAVGVNGVRYQIKGRRLTPENHSQQLGAIRDIEQQPFDVLLAVFFNEDLDVQEILEHPIGGRQRGVLRGSDQLNAICVDQEEAQRPTRSSARVRSSSFSSVARAVELSVGATPFTRKQ